MTIRSKIRPVIYSILDLIGKVSLVLIAGVFFFVVISATSFYWIPLAFVLWFKEEPVWEGVANWFLNNLLNPRINPRVF